MKDIHPEYHPVIFKDGEHEVVTRSTATSDQTREVDGVEHYVIKVDVSAFTHPFYTGQKKLVDTEGRVDRFKKRYNLDDDGDDQQAEASDEDEQSEASDEDEQSEASDEDEQTDASDEDEE